MNQFTTNSPKEAILEFLRPVTKQIRTAMGRALPEACKLFGIYRLTGIVLTAPHDHKISSGTTSPDRNLPRSCRISSALRCRSFSNSISTLRTKQQAPQSEVNSRCSLQRMSSWTSVRLMCLFTKAEICG